MVSPLESLRKNALPQLPHIFHDLHQLHAYASNTNKTENYPCASFFPLTGNQSTVFFQTGGDRETKPLRIGVVLSGGQAAGGHNVISGLYDALMALNSHSILVGFLNGPSGIIKCDFKELNAQTIDAYRNLGGFDMIGSGRTKIETQDQLIASRQTINSLDLDGLVIIGGDDSNTNAAILAEDFKANGIKTCVIGVPKTIDGDLKNAWVETSFGFDSACKTYAEMIGNIAKDALSAKKYYHFIKLMGRSASHIALECALQVQPNYTLISEEVEQQGKTLQELTSDICDVICKRAEESKNYGIILIPEGILEFIPECKLLIKELNSLLNNQQDDVGEKLSTTISSKLSSAAQKCFFTLPQKIQKQLLLDRDPHGNIQVSKIETENLFIELVQAQLKIRSAASHYKGQFSAQPHFFGYEGRSCAPSNFDANYCYGLGHVAALLLTAGLTGYMACVRKLSEPVSEWNICGIPLVSLMHQEERKGKNKPVIKKAHVDLQGAPFKSFAEKRLQWVLEDLYISPGPIQFFGPHELSDSITHTLLLESRCLQHSM